MAKKPASAAFGGGVHHCHVIKCHVTIPEDPPDEHISQTETKLVFKLLE